MPVKIRLARHGKKNKPFYHIVVADSRAPRDGRFIERIGSYNPTMNPAFVELDFDKALNWLLNGAQPTDTCRSILSRQGVMMKKHLLEGVKKNAFTEEEAEVRYQKWLADKQKAIDAQKDKAESLQKETQRKLFEAEAKVREERAQAIAKRNAELARKAEGATRAEEVSEQVEVAVEDLPASDSQIEEVVSESPEEVVAETEVAQEKPDEEPVAKAEAAEPADTKEAPEES